MSQRLWIVALTLAVGPVLARSAGPEGPKQAAGRPHVLTIEGTSTVRFDPVAGLPDVPIEYRARVEYLAATREAGPEDTVAAPKRSPRKKAAAPPPGAGEAAAAAPATVIELTLHSVEGRYLQNGQPVVAMKAGRARFVGNILPGGPTLNVRYAEAPPRLQELLKVFDRPAASVLFDERSRVIGRKIRSEAPLAAVNETLLSIHTPIPKDVGAWESPTRLAMGNNQTARGTLRFEKVKVPVDPAEPAEIVVKVSGTLKAEGAVAGRFVKEGTYRVDGEQRYDPGARLWTSARWKVDVDVELANPGGQTVARSKGSMVVESLPLKRPDAEPGPRDR